MISLLIHRRLFIMFLDKLARRLLVLMQKQSGLFTQKSARRVAGMLLQVAFIIASTTFSDKSPYLPHEWASVTSEQISELKRKLLNDKMQLQKCLQEFTPTLNDLNGLNLAAVNSKLSVELIYMLRSQQTMLIETQSEVVTLSFLKKMKVFSQLPLNEYLDFDLLAPNQIEQLERQDTEKLMPKLIKWLLEYEVQAVINM